MRQVPRRRTFSGMPLWLLTILICGIIWVLGTIFVAFGATWLVRHQPH